MTGIYITIEGIDGSGKTTLVRSLGEAFPDAVTTAEPDDTLWTGRAVREAISRETAAPTDALLFLADRAEHLERTVVPALNDGTVVISDRGHDSTYAYQVPRISDELDVHPRTVRVWLDLAYSLWNVEPDLTIWLDTPVERAAARMSGEEKWADADFMKRVRAGYELQMRREPGRVRRVNGGLPKDRVVDEAARLVGGLL